MITIARERERISFQRRESYFLFTYVPSGNRICIRIIRILTKFYAFLWFLLKKGELCEGNSRTSFDAFEIYVNPYEREIREIKKGIKERQIQREINNGWWCTSILSSISAKPLWMLISRPDLFHSFKQKCFFYFPFTVFISLDKEGISIVEGSLRFI